MQTIEKEFTPEQLELLRDLYFIDEEGIVYAVVPEDMLKNHSPKIIDKRYNVVLTPEDFSYAETRSKYLPDFYYKYDKNGNKEWLWRHNVPEELVEILDSNIKKRMNKAEKSRANTKEYISLTQ